MTSVYKDKATPDNGVVSLDRTSFLLRVSFTVMWLLDILDKSLTLQLFRSQVTYPFFSKSWNEASSAPI
jgi:hypothetical protein